MDGEKRRKVGSSFLSASEAVPLAVVMGVQSYSSGSTGTILPRLLQIRLLSPLFPYSFPGHFGHVERGEACLRLSRMLLAVQVSWPSGMLREVLQSIWSACHTLDISDSLCVRVYVCVLSSVQAQCGENQRCPFSEQMKELPIILL